MKHYRFKDISITSSKIPNNTHLLLEVKGVLVIAEGDNIYYSIDKADNWIGIDTGTTHDNMENAFHDRDNDKVYFQADTGAGGNSAAYELDATDADPSNWTITELGQNIDGPPLDIWVRDGNIEQLTVDDVVDDDLEIWRFGGGIWTEIIDLNVQTVHPFCSKGIVIGTDVYFVYAVQIGTAKMLKFTGAAFVELDTINASREIPETYARQGLAYDGSNIIHFTLSNLPQTVFKLMSYSISGDVITEVATYDISIMLDRNNAGNFPSELEKIFGISNEIVYEIKPRRGGIIQLQNISAITDANIIALTDNFLMNSDGDMFEWTNVNDEMFKLSYIGGIFPLIKKGSFLTLRYYESNWNEKDSIKVYDDNDVLDIWAKITKKYVDTLGQTHFDFDFYSNELARTTYNKTFSNNKTSEKLIDIIDNGMNFLYQSSSIIATTIQYDYEFIREAMFMFSTARWLEREVLYAEPDGKTWSKAYDGLAKNPLIYPGTYNFKDDEDDSAPSGWTEADTGTTTSRVITSLDGHRKIVHFNDDDAAGRCYIFRSFTQSAGQTIEFWIRTSDDTKKFFIYFYEGATRIVNMLINVGKLQNVNGGFTDIANLSNDTWHHIRLDLDDTANTYDCYVDGVVKADLGYDNNSTISPSIIWLFSDVADTGYDVYFDALGISAEPAYAVGDNEVAWSLYNGHQDVRLVNIPNMSLDVGGYFNGNLGVTRATVRYKNNATTTKPDSPESVEQATGIIEAKEYRDARLEGATEADQLATNRFNIGSADIQFIGLRVQGQGFLQEGKTVNLENTQSITIAENDFTILRYRRFPKQDITIMVLSDNIIFPQEFTSFLDTTRTQIHAANLQAIENQFDINLHLTREGGIGLKLTNKTGVASVKGTIVEAHAGIDNAFRVCDANSNESFAIVYEDGIADGDECFIVTGGRVQVLLKDATASTRNFWVKVSDVAGRADATNASPAAAPTHFLEIGHCIESKGADTDVLAYIITHRN